MTIFLVNAYSDNMLTDISSKVITEQITFERFMELINNEQCLACIGQDNIARYLTLLTGKTFTKNRKGIRVNYDDLIIKVEFTNKLPKDFTMEDYYNITPIFLLKRFEKQSPKDLMKTERIIREKIGA